MKYTIILMLGMCVWLGAGCTRQAAPVIQPSSVSTSTEESVSQKLSQARNDILWVQTQSVRDNPSLKIVNHAGTEELIYEESFGFVDSCDQVDHRLKIHNVATGAERALLHAEEANTFRENGCFRPTSSVKVPSSWTVVGWSKDDKNVYFTRMPIIPKGDAEPIQVLLGPELDVINVKTVIRKVIYGDLLDEHPTRIRAIAPELGLMVVERGNEGGEVSVVLADLTGNSLKEVSRDFIRGGVSIAKISPDGKKVAMQWYKQDLGTEGVRYDYELVVISADGKTLTLAETPDQKRAWILDGWSDANHVRLLTKGVQEGDKIVEKRIEVREEKVGN